jgi:hypothetical protein
VAAEAAPTTGVPEPPCCFLSRYSSCPVTAPTPATVAGAPSPAQLRVLSRYSPHAVAVARLLAETSTNGRENDPAMSADAVRETIKLADEDIAEAVHELEHDGLVHRHQSLGMGAIGFYALAPRAGFFQVFDPALGIGDPVADARLVAAALITVASR